MFDPASRLLLKLFLSELFFIILILFVHDVDEFTDIEIGVVKCGTFGQVTTGLLPYHLLKLFQVNIYLGPVYLLWIFDSWEVA